jgi:hypothetical protein
MLPTAARIIDLPSFPDARGHLGVVEVAQHIGFAIERAFYIYNTPSQAHRGGHAHKTLKQFLISLGAPITLRVHDGQRESAHTLEAYTQGLYLPPGHWIDIDQIAPNTTLLVLCSAPYDETDYLRNFVDFFSHHAALASVSQP